MSSIANLNEPLSYLMGSAKVDLDVAEAQEDQADEIRRKDARASAGG